MSRFCHRGPASDALSLLQMLSHGGARPFDGSAGSSPAGAKGRAPLVDFCNRIDPRARPGIYGSPEPRAPCKWSPTCAALVADGYAGPSRSGFLSVARFAGARPVESSRVRDRGPGAFAPHYLGTSHCDRSPRELYPNPIDSDTSCRKLVTSQAGVSYAAGPRFREPMFTCLPDDRR